MLHAVPKKMKNFRRLIPPGACGIICGMEKEKKIDAGEYGAATTAMVLVEEDWFIAGLEGADGA